MFGGLRQKIVDGLRKTRDAIADRVERIASVGRPVDDALLDELEEALLSADLGPSSPPKCVRGSARGCAASR